MQLLYKHKKYSVIFIILVGLLGIFLYLKFYLNLSIKPSTLYKNKAMINTSKTRPATAEEVDQHIMALQELASKKNTQALTELTTLANNGNANAQSKLAMLYATGDGVEKNLQKAFDLYTQASKKGSSVAQLNLGFYYESGVHVKQDYSKAAELYTQAIESKDISVKSLAQFNLANLYRQGLGVEKNIEKAITLYETIASGVDTNPKEQSALYKETLGGALTALGHFSRDKKELDKARQYYSLASKLGSISAKTNLGYDYLTGNGVTKDIPMAIELLTYAAKRGEPIAQINLGVCYLNGVGVKKDVKKAMELFKASADQGCEKAINILNTLKQASNN